MTLNELLNKGSLFTEIKDITGLKFFNNINPIKMDILAGDIYGDRTLSSKYETRDIKEISELISIMFSNKWVDLETLLNDTPLNNTYVTTEERTETEKENNNNESVNKLAGFNSDEMVVNDSSNNIGVNDKEIAGDKVTKREEKNLVNSLANLNNKILNGIIETVISDVSKFLTLNIY